MKLSNFEDKKNKIMEEAKKKLEKLEQEEQKLIKRKISPLISKYTNLTEEVLNYILNKNIEKIDNVKFKKAEIKNRIKDFFEKEIELMIKDAEENKDKIQGIIVPKEDV